MKNSHRLTAVNGVKLICVATAAAIALRSLLMLFFFDFDTGFYTDGGWTAWLSLLLPAAAVAAAAALCRRDQESLGPWQSLRRPVLGALAALSGALLVTSALVMAVDFRAYLDTGASQFESVRQGANHVLYIAASLLFGAVQLAGAAGLVSGRDLFVKAPLLYVPAVLWGVANLVMVYVFYAKFSSPVENVFSMVGAAALLLALLYLCRLFAGAGPQGAGLRLLMTGGPAVMLTVGSQTVDLAMRLSGKTYAGELPSCCQLSVLGVGLFVLAAMVSYVGHGQEEEAPRQDPAEGEHEA